MLNYYYSFFHSLSAPFNCTLFFRLLRSQPCFPFNIYWSKSCFAAKFLVVRNLFLHFLSLKKKTERYFNNNNFNLRIFMFMYVSNVQWSNIEFFLLIRMIETEPDKLGRRNLAEMFLLCELYSKNISQSVHL